MKAQRELLFLIILTGLTTAILHFFATTFYIYWSLPWFDVVMHFLGGAFTAFVMSWVFIYIYRSSSRDVWYYTFFIGLSVLLVGVGWEVFEAVTKTTGVVPGESYLDDTVFDLIMDLLGGGVVGLYTYNYLYEKS